MATTPRGKGRRRSSRLPNEVSERRSRLAHATDARRKLSRAEGRAWLNGKEVGGADGRYAHLGRSHD